MSAHLPAVLVRRFVIRRVRQYSTDPAPVLACPHLTQDYTHGKCEMNPEYIYIYKHILIRYVYSIDHVTCSTYVCIHTYIYLDIHLNLNMGYPPNNFHWMIMMKLRSAGRDVPWSLMTFLCA